MKKNKEIQEKVMDKIITKIEAGKFTWQKPWKNGILPMNYHSKKPYQGINFLFTFAADFESPFYLTFNQVKELKGFVKKDSEGTPIIFYKQLEKINIVEGTEKKEFIPLLKTFTVFNENQIEGIECETEMFMGAAALFGLGVGGGSGGVGVGGTTFFLAAC